MTKKNIATLFAVVALVMMTSGCDKGSSETPQEDTKSGGLDTTCSPACEGKQCGEDGCGGVCGQCDADELCVQGTCSSPAPSCGDGDCIPPETHESCPEDCEEPFVPECSSDADCEGTPPCPAEAVLGCICVEASCVLACEEDKDCPMIPNLLFKCAPGGYCEAEESETICGDGDCTPPETHESCPEDCEDPVEPLGCKEDADCEGTPPCHPDATMGCICVENPDGGGNCIPACDEDADCPDVSGITFACTAEGYCGIESMETICGDGECIPPETHESCPEDCEDPVEPEGCQEDADCEGTPPCHPDAIMGCICVENPDGGGDCIPACDEDADCPDVSGITFACTAEGYCGIESMETICGDGACMPPETHESCPEDCEEPVEPTGCQEDIDCMGTPPCPVEALMGCVCVQNPDGGGDCIPACDEDGDCPEIPGVTITCTPEGYCVK